MSVIAFVLIGYGLLIIYAIWQIETKMMKDVKPDILKEEEKKDPYKKYRNTDGLLGSKPWKKE